MGRPKKRTMRAVKKKGFDGVYARIYGGKVTGYTSFVSDKTVKGGRRQLKTWPTATDAKEERDAALRAGTSTGSRSTLREFYENTYVPNHLDTLKPGSKKSVEAGLKAFLSKYGDIPANRLDLDDIRRWGLTTSLNQAQYARAFLYHAKDHKVLLADNPLAKLGRRSSHGRANVDIISETDLYGLADCAIDALGPDYGPVFRARLLFGAYTCLRPNEVWPLLDSNVFLDYVRVREAVSGGQLVDFPKNGKWRNKSPLPAPARRVLDAMPRNDASPYAFWAVRGQMLTKSTDHLYWDKVRRAYAAKTGDPRWLDFDLYELRHFGASFMLNDLELPAELVAWVLGHSGKTGVDLVLRLYGHPQEDRWHARVLAAFDRHEERQQAARDEAAGVRRLRVVE